LGGNKARTFSERPLYEHDARIGGRTGSCAGASETVDPIYSGGQAKRLPIMSRDRGAIGLFQLRTSERRRPTTLRRMPLGQPY